MKNTEEILRSIFLELKEKHNLTCQLSDAPTENFMMEFAYEQNAITYNTKMLEDNYDEGRKKRVYNIPYRVFILYCLTHEIGHYLDYKENKDAFNFTNKEEYIQMEKRGIEKAMTIIPPFHYTPFKIFNENILRSYESMEM